MNNTNSSLSISFIETAAHRSQPVKAALQEAVQAALDLAPLPVGTGKAVLTDSQVAVDLEKEQSPQDLWGSLGGRLEPPDKAILSGLGEPTDHLAVERVGKEQGLVFSVFP